MKQLVLIGGFIGFLLALIIGLSVPGRALPSVFLQSCAGALAGGWLMRWWGAQWRRSWILAQAERRDNEVKAATEQRVAVKSAN